MAIAIGLWSVDLGPNEKITLTPPADLRVTNAALGGLREDVNAASRKRTSIQVGYATTEPDSGDEAKRVTVLCSLINGQIEQCTLDVILEEGEEYSISSSGPDRVCLTGNYIDQSHGPPFFGNDSDEDDYDLRDVSSDVEIDASELGGIDSDGSRFEEVLEDAVKSQALKRPRESVEVDSATEKKLTKAEKRKAKKLKSEGDAAAVPAGSAAASIPPTKAEKEKSEKQDTPAKGEKPAPKPAKAATVDLPDGVKYVNSKIGTGPQAKSGNTVSVRYIGKLANGKIFDKNTKGKPFTFRLGQGEVIKGWDSGIVGMQVGGERLLTIPPNMGYGKKDNKDIPANSTLIFECKLLGIN